MKEQLVFLFLICACLQLPAQEKAPICYDDFRTVKAGATVNVDVTANDWWMQGHQVTIIFSSQSNGAIISSLDKWLIYRSHYYFEGVDTVTYKLKDINNGLVSEKGHLIVTVNNPGKSFLEINDIRAMINSYGYQFCDFAGYTPWFEVPKNSGISSVFSLALWMGGKAPDTTLHVAAERYRQQGADYFNGPVAENYAENYNFLWNRVWEINRDELEDHKQNWNEAGYIVPEAIQSWAAHGNTSIGQASELAPFIDWNNDGTYQPEWGDMPAVRGDQSLFFIYNDDFAEHSETFGKKIGVDILVQAYGFDCPDDSVLNQSIFLHYDIINRSEQNYYQFYTGFYVDFDLGNPWDDYVGCDTINQAIYVYNGDSFDDPTTIFGSAGYGEHPPALAIVMLNRAFCSCAFPSESSGPAALPYSYDEVYNNLRGLWRDGTQILYNNEPTKFMFTGDPVSNTGWTEALAGNPPNDRRALASVGPQTFFAGDTISLNLGFVWARDYEGDNISSVALLQERIAALRWFYENDSTPCGVIWMGVNHKAPAVSEINVYPNPANQFINLELESSGPINYKVIDIMGRVVLEDQLNASKQIDIVTLPEGIYILTIQTNSTTMTKKFIKR